MVAAHLVISGIVQGVGYRFSCLREAEERELAGWVRNLPDGFVEALAQGPREKVEDLIRWCYRGPWGARVSKIDVTWQDPEKGLKGFRIR